MKYNSGDIIVKQGAFISQMMYLQKGVVKIVIEENNSRSTSINLSASGQFISVSIIGGNSNYLASVIALTNVEICAIHQSYYLEWSARSDIINNMIIDNITKSYIEMCSKISMLNTRNNHGKLATTLLYLMHFSSTDMNVFEFVTRKDISELACISLESVNKILVELKNDKIIDIENKTIKILQPNLMNILSQIG
ncbi:MAG: Crp/Fnr family transcriptional regulator [Bacteroidales bacterium]|nr:Crp/Fnr family transcriptional regulator [Bacteroidales bacterium]